MRIVFAVKARRAESETEPERFVGTGPRTADRDRRCSTDGDADPLAKPLVDALSVPTVVVPSEELDRPAEVGEPGDEVIDRSCPLEGWRWGERLPLPEAPAMSGRPILEAAVPGVVAEVAAPELAVPGVPATAGFVVDPAAGFVVAVEPAGVPDADDFDVADADVADPPEVRSWPGPVPAAGAVGCSAVAGGRTSVEVDLSGCVGFCDEVEGLSAAAGPGLTNVNGGLPEDASF